MEDGEIGIIPVRCLERINMISMQDDRDEGAKKGYKRGDNIEHSEVRVNNRSLSDGGNKMRTQI